MTSVEERPTARVRLMGAGRRAVAAGALLLALASCAPRPAGPPPLDAGGRLARFRAELAAREQRARMATGEATLWPRGPAACDSCAPVRLPAVQADLVVAAPETFRLRVRSAFGTAVDVGLRGDSLFAHAPGPGLAFALDAVRDSFGPPAPGRLAARLVAALWRPPAVAVATWGETGLELRWREDGDSLAVTLDAAGLPAGAWWRREGGPRARVRYTRWETTDGVRWPMAWSLDGGGGGPGLECRLQRVAFASRPDVARLAVRLPDGAALLDADGARRLLGALGWSR
jgi:hypothetical protein